MNLDEKRANMVHGLRKLADMLADVNTPLPYDVQCWSHWQLTPDGRLGEANTQDIARATMGRNPGNWSKTMHGDLVTYTRQITDTVSYEISIPRDTVCTRVKTGERQVPARTEAIYEWQCGQDV